jgi:hypothetical protein
MESLATGSDCISVPVEKFKRKLVRVAGVEPETNPIKH